METTSPGAPGSGSPLVVDTCLPRLTLHAGNCNQHRNCSSEWRQFSRCPSPVWPQLQAGIDIGISTT